MLVKARGWLYFQSDLENVKEVVREWLRSFLWRDGGKYEVDLFGKSNISLGSYRNGKIEGKRNPEKTLSHVELELYLGNHSINGGIKVKTDLLTLVPARIPSTCLRGTELVDEINNWPPLCCRPFQKCDQDLHLHKILRKVRAIEITGFPTLNVFQILHSDGTHFGFIEDINKFL